MNGVNELEHVREVLARHRETLMALPGATGTGIGASASGSGYVIVVYLVGPANGLPGPEELEGVAVQYTVTGAFSQQNLTNPPKN